MDYTVPQPKPGIASFASESWGNSGEPIMSPTPPVAEIPRMVTAGADIDWPIYSVVSLIGGVIALAAVGAASGSATGTITLATAVPSADETVTINGRIYTFKAAVGVTADEVLIGADLATTAANLADAINADADNAGVTYGSATTANEDVWATVAGAVVTIAALDPGDEGNAITLATDGANITVSGATLSGGDDDMDIKPYGITAAPLVMSNGDTMSVPIYVSGHWNMDALNWDPSYNTDDAKRVAFEGSVNPTILIDKAKFNSTGIPV